MTPEKRLLVFYLTLILSYTGEISLDTIRPTQQEKKQNHPTVATDVHVMSDSMGQASENSTKKNGMSRL